MKRSLLALALAASLSTGLAVAARADEAAPSAAAQQTAQLPASTVQSEAFQAYKANLNPNAVVPSTGVYDQEDRYTGPSGRPLPGWGAVFGEGGDN